MSKKKIIYLIIGIVILLFLCIFLFLNRGIKISVGKVKDVSSVIHDKDYTIDGDCILMYDKKIIGVTKGSCNLVVDGKKNKVTVSEGNSEEVVLVVGDKYNISENINVKDFVVLDNSYISYSNGIITGLQAGSIKAAAISNDDEVFVFNIIVKDTKTSNALVNGHEELTDDMNKILKKLGNGYVAGGIWDGNNTLSNKAFYSNSNVLKEYFKFIKKSGFSSVRIPISVYNHMDSNYKIEASWLNTINYVVDAATAANLYVIVGLNTINSSNDNYCVSDTSKCFISAKSSEYEKSSKYLITVWKQIAEKLKDKNNRVLFEGFDSIININEKDIHNPICNNNIENDSCDIVNKLNVAFVNAVRETGGNNSIRFLVCSTYDGSINVNSNGGVGPVNAFVIPDEDEYVIMGVKVFNNSNITVKYFKENFVDKKIPVLVSSYGNKDNKTNSAARGFEIIEYNSKFVSNSIPNFLWDNGKDMKVLVNINKANSANDIKDAWDYNYGLVMLLNTKMDIE